MTLLISFSLVCHVREEGSYDGQRLFKRATIKVPSDIVLKGLAGCTEIVGSLVFEIPKGTGI